MKQIVASLFAIVFLPSQLYTGAGITLVGGILFNYLFINGYVKQKLDKKAS